MGSKKSDEEMPRAYSDANIILFAVGSGLSLKIDPLDRERPWMATLADFSANGATPELAVRSLYNKWARFLSGESKQDILGG